MSDDTRRNVDTCERCGGTNRYDLTPDMTTAATAGFPCPRCTARLLLAGGQMTAWVGKSANRRWFTKQVESHMDDLRSATEQPLHDAGGTP